MVLKKTDSPAGRVSKNEVPVVPQGKQRIKWYGPGLLWMLSAVGTGSILFTPRVAAAYCYSLLWLLLVVVFLMWIMIREMARYSIATGETMLAGMNRLRGPRGWALWVVLIPQLLAAIVGIAGLAAVAGSALAAFAPGGLRFYAVLLVVGSTVLTVSGHYETIERISHFMVFILMGVAIVSACMAASGWKAFGQGLLFHWPDDPDLYVILPWVGTILAGSMGIVWFGYWTGAKGFGGGLSEQSVDADTVRVDEKKIGRMRGWFRLVSSTATLGVLGGLAVIFSFMVLGAELLAPKGLMPRGADVAVDLTHLFSDLWGRVGTLMMLVCIVVALGGSILANQDGWGRSFSDMTRLLLAGKKGIKREKLPDRRNLKRIYILVVTGLLPVVIIVVFKDPVKVMSVSGIIAAIHTPFLVGLALLVNRIYLPRGIRPGWFCSTMMALAGLFYLAFAVLYFANLSSLLS